MSANRISEVRIRGLRVLEDVTIRLPASRPLVLIGDNGSGKSSVLEAFEVLRRGAAPDFVQALQSVHGGRALVRAGQDQLALSIVVNGEDSISYGFVLEVGHDGSLRLLNEYLNLTAHGAPEPFQLISRTREAAHVFNQAQGKLVALAIPVNVLTVAAFGLLPPHPAIARVREMLDSIEIHAGFETWPPWVGEDGSAVRRSTVLEPAVRLERLGRNLASVYHALKNDHSDDEWRATMELVRLGLGRDIDSVNTRVDPGGGAVALQVKLRGLREQIPAFSLSDGMLTYLAFVAIRRLPSTASIIAFDEPETHLHPELLGRVVGFLEDIARERPVVLATHSDRLLDMLEEPAESVALLELDGSRRTRVLRPDKSALDGWLERYRGIGDLRAGGDAASVLTIEERAE